MIMKKNDSKTFKKVINDVGVAFMGIPTKESLNYMPYGELIRNSLYTKALNVKYKDQLDNRNKPTYFVHFGLSENILFSYLLNSCDGNNLRLYSFIAPIQVSILNALNNEKNDNIINNFIDCLKDNNITYNTEKIIRKKITSKTN